MPVAAMTNKTVLRQMGAPKPMNTERKKKDQQEENTKEGDERGDEPSEGYVSSSSCWCEAWAPLLAAEVWNDREAAATESDGAVAPRLRIAPARRT